MHSLILIKGNSQTRNCEFLLSTLQIYPNMRPLVVFTLKVCLVHSESNYNFSEQFHEILFGIYLFLRRQCPLAQFLFVLRIQQAPRSIEKEFLKVCQQQYEKFSYKSLETVQQFQLVCQPSRQSETRLDFHHSLPGTFCHGTSILQGNQHITMYGRCFHRSTITKICQNILGTHKKNLHKYFSSPTREWYRINFNRIYPMRQPR